MGDIVKYIKLIFVFVIIIFIAGCKKEYNLYVYDNKIVEKFHMEIESENKYTKLYSGNINPLHGNFTDIYKKNLEKKGKKDILDLEYTYTPELFANANSINQCFDERKVTYSSDNYFEIILGKPNGCMFKENYTINIITDNVVVSNNADKVTGNKYSWNVKNDGKSNFNLKIKIKKGDLKRKKNNSNIVIYIVVGIIIISFSAVIYFTYKRRKKNNEF